MTTLTPIAADSLLLPYVWEELSRSIDGSGQTEEDVLWLVREGSVQLWALEDSAEVIGAVATAVEGAVLFVMHLAAQSFDDLAEQWHVLETYGREHGAVSMRGRCTPRAARFFNHTIGSKTLYCVVEQDLTGA